LYLTVLARENERDTVLYWLVKGRAVEGSMEKCSRAKAPTELSRMARHFLRKKVLHSRMPFVRTYHRDTQELVFDAHDKAFGFYGGVCRVP
jgi:hypothetical protein